MVTRTLSMGTGSPFVTGKAFSGYPLLTPPPLGCDPTRQPVNPAEGIGRPAMNETRTEPNLSRIVADLRVVAEHVASQQGGYSGHEADLARLALRRVNLDALSNV